jgi:hypothetical protein
MTNTAKKTVNPFKVAKTKKTASKTSAVAAPEEVQAAVAEYKEAQEQMKHYEGLMNIHKDAILSFAKPYHAKKNFAGCKKGFKILGKDESMTSYVAQDRGRSITEEEADAFEERFGEKAREDLIVVDYGSISFNAEVLEANYDAVVGALQTLPPEVLENLFKETPLKACKGALEDARNHVESAEEMEEICNALKLTSFLR